MESGRVRVEELRVGNRVIERVRVRDASEWAKG